jgi:hypothetical protein
MALTPTYFWRLGLEKCRLHVEGVLRQILAISLASGKHKLQMAIVVTEGAVLKFVILRELLKDFECHGWTL